MGIHSQLSSRRCAQTSTRFIQSNRDGRHSLVEQHNRTTSAHWSWREVKWNRTSHRILHEVLQSVRQSRGDATLVNSSHGEESSGSRVIKKNGNGEWRSCYQRLIDIDRSKKPKKYQKSKIHRFNTTWTKIAKGEGQVQCKDPKMGGGGRGR